MRKTILYLFVALLALGVSIALADPIHIPTRIETGPTVGRAAGTLTGSIDPTASASIVGVGTHFLTELRPGDQIDPVTGVYQTVLSCSSDTACVLDSPCTDGANNTTVHVHYAVASFATSSGSTVRATQDTGASLAITAGATPYEKIVPTGGPASTYNEYISADVPNGYHPLTSNRTHWFGWNANPAMNGLPLDPAYGTMGISIEDNFEVSSGVYQTEMHMIGGQADGSKQVRLWSAYVNKADATDSGITHSATTHTFDRWDGALTWAEITKRGLTLTPEPLTNSSGNNYNFHITTAPVLTGTASWAALAIDADLSASGATSTGEHYALNLQMQKNIAHGNYRALHVSVTENGSDGGGEKYLAYFDNGGTWTLRAGSDGGFDTSGLSRLAYNSGTNRSGLYVTSSLTATLGKLRVAYDTATPAGGNATYGMELGSANVGVYFGSGVPTLSAAKGSLYLRTDGSTTNDRMYVNTNGSTAWTAVTTEN